MINIDGSAGQIQPLGERIRKAVRWISECVESHPEKSRQEILHEATLRFDLTPVECDFILEKLREEAPI